MTPRQSKPILFLDVDGVIGPMLHRDPSRLPNTWPNTWVWERTGPYDLLLNRTMIEALEEILEDVNMVWCTTWEHNVRAIEERLGWPPHPVVSNDRGNHDHVPWKHRAIVNTLVGQTQRPFIVLDDHSVHHSNEWMLVDLLSEAHVSARRLLIAPHSLVGLEPKHMERMRRFIHHVRGFSR